MAEEVDRGDRNEEADQPGCYCAFLQAAAVELEGEEADADVEGFAGDLVFVD